MPTPPPAPLPLQHNTAMQEAGKLASDVSSAMVHVGLRPHCRAAVFGANCPEWMLSMQVAAWLRVGCLDEG